MPCYYTWIVKTVCGSGQNPIHIIIPTGYVALNGKWLQLPSFANWMDLLFWHAAAGHVSGTRSPHQNERLGCARAALSELEEAHIREKIYRIRSTHTFQKAGSMKPAMGVTPFSGVYRLLKPLIPKVLLQLNEKSHSPPSKRCYSRCYSGDLLSGTTGGSHQKYCTCISMYGTYDVVMLCWW